MLSFRLFALPMAEAAGDGHMAAMESSSIISRWTLFVSPAVWMNQQPQPHSVNVLNLSKGLITRSWTSVVSLSSSTFKYLLVINLSDSLSEGTCQTGYRKCGTGSSEKCIGANEPCMTENSPCLLGRTLCGDESECALDHYIRDGYKKECDGKFMWGWSVCKHNGENCQEGKRTKCGDKCIENNYYEAYGYRECAGQCLSGSQNCCDGQSLVSLETTAGPTDGDCCIDGYYTCGKECRLVPF